MQTVAALGQLEHQDTAGAHTRLRAVESAARQALAELRRVVGLLDEASDTPLQPPPSLDRLPVLATQLQAAGVPLDMRVDADPSSLPPGLALAAYRIIQEALTNIIKHAGPCHASVTVTQTPQWLDVLITDDGRGGTPTPGCGRGLPGMRERVTLYDGQLTAGPGTQGGFNVHARFPTPLEAAT